MSLTHGQNPRKHIWTFAGASDETNQQYYYKCPCINTALTSSRVPSFVGNDYISVIHALSGPFPNTNQVYTYDPLWDGKGCGSTNRCCSFNTPLWFVKNLSSTTDNIEMRMCRPDGSGATPYKRVELYLQ